MFSIVLIGGMGSVPGVIIGAAAISLFPEVFRSFANYRMVVFGAGDDPHDDVPTRRTVAPKAGRHRVAGSPAEAVEAACLTRQKAQ